MQGKQCIVQKSDLRFSPQLQRSLKILELPAESLEGYLQDIAYENPFIEYEVSSQPPRGPSDDFLHQIPDRPKSLKEAVFDQFQFLTFSRAERPIADHFLDCLQDDGYLHPDALDIPGDKNLKDAVLKKLQTLDPIGIFARDLVECLQIQLIDLNIWSPKYDMVLKNLHKIAQGHLNISPFLAPDDVKSCLRNIRKLTPKPGLTFHENDGYVTPEIKVWKQPHDEWRVSFTNQYHFQVLEHKYHDFSQRCDRQEKGQLKRCVSDARWVKKALLQRLETLEKIVTSLIDAQKNFLEKGPSFLSPLALKDVAQNIGMHESTISRAISNKYIETPFGTFALKRFFSSRVDKNSSSLSGGAIKTRLQAAIREEDRNTPFSDDELVILLRRQGISVARRTIAKYRQALNIPSSHLRKRLSTIQAACQ